MQQAPSRNFADFTDVLFRCAKNSQFIKLLASATPCKAMGIYFLGVSSSCLSNGAALRDKPGFLLLGAITASRLLLESLLQSLTRSLGFWTVLKHVCALVAS
jgi:hypothetical protein